MNIINTLGSLFRPSSTGSTKPPSATTPVPANQPIIPPKRGTTWLDEKLAVVGRSQVNDGGKSHTQAGGN
jgi:hypothetical protein